MRDFIILEGPDCSGKSTLGKFLANCFGGLYWHASGNVKLHTGMFAYHSNILDNVEWNLRHGKVAPIILDRSWPSEYVYTKILRPVLHPAFCYQAVRNRITDLKGVYVFCDTPDIVRLHDQERNPTHAYGAADFGRIVHEYRVFFHEHEGGGMPVLRYDRCEHSQQQMANLIKDWMP